MSKQKKSEKLSGAEGFEKYYFELFQDRWSDLKKALLLPPKYMAWNVQKICGGHFCGDDNSNIENRDYYLDSGSVLAALSLPLGENLKILDMCAAPGGKSLVIATRMDKNSYLVSNERSPSRKIRLKRVLDEQIPQEIKRRIKVTGFDASKWCCYETESYDRILLDAPCSSERHVFSDEKYLAQWSPSRIKTLSIAQWSLISSAFRVLKKDGFLMYATCALSPEENDKIIEHLTKKFDNAVVFKEINPDIGIVKKALGQSAKNYLPSYEKTEFGFHILPDTQNGAGPLFFSIIGKI